MRRAGSSTQGVLAVGSALRVGAVALLLASQSSCSAGGEPPVSGSRKSALKLQTLGLDAPRIQASAGPQWQPHVSAGGGLVFAGWTDCRFNSCSTYDAVGVRLTEGGELLDPTGLRISGPESQFGAQPVSAFLGNRFLLAWCDEGRVRGWYRLLPTDGGSATAPDRLTGLPPDSYGGYPDISVEGDHALVVWDSFDGPEPVGMAVILPDGRRTTPDGGVGFGPPARNNLARTLWSGSAHLVAFRSTPFDGGVLVGAGTVHVDGGLPVADSFAWVGGPEPKGRPVLAASGGVAVIAWPTAAEPWGVQFAPQLPGGVGSSPPSLWVPTASRVTDMALAPADGGFLLLRSEVPDGGSLVFATVVPADGGARGPDHLLSSGRYAADVAVTPVDGGFFAVWTLDEQVVGAPLTPEGQAVASPKLLARAANSQVGPAVAAVDGGFLVAWFDNRDDDPGLRVTQVSLQGEVRTPAGIVVEPITPQYGSISGTSWLLPTSEARWLATHRRQELTFHRLDDSGGPGGPPVRLDAGYFFSRPVQHGAAVAWATGQGGDQALFQLGPDGTLLGPETGTPLPREFSPAWSLVLASTGRRLLVARASSGSSTMLWLEQDGGLTDAGSVPRSAGPGQIALFGGQGAVLVLEASGSPDLRFRALRLREDGRWVDAAPVELLLDAGTGSLPQTFAPRGSWTGNGWELALPWSSETSGPTALVHVPLTAPPELRAWIPAGAASAAGSAQGQILVATRVEDESPLVMSERVQLTLASTAALGAACTTNGDCASAACVEGVCGPPVCTLDDCFAAEPMVLRVGCGCGAGAAALPLAVAALALVLQRRRRTG